MRLPESPRTAAALAVLGLIVCLPVGCAVPDHDAAVESPVYVLNFYGAEHGRAEQRPGDLVLSESTTVNGVTWRRWGPGGAVGTGKLTGMWCLPECDDTPYPATVTLSGVIPVRGKGYFTRYEVEAEIPAEQRDQADLAGRLRIP